MRWELEWSLDAKKQLERLDRYTQRLIASWIQKHLLSGADPRATGKPLAANFAGYWRYRIGDYRMVCKIIDQRILIIVMRIGHRSDIYR